MAIAHPALAPPLITSRPTPDGGRILGSEIPLEPYEASLGLLLRRWAADAPDRTFLAERDSGGVGWRTLTFAEASRRADAVAQAPLDPKRGAARPPRACLIGDAALALRPTRPSARPRPPTTGGR